MARVRITRADSELGTIDEADLAAAQASGFRVVDESEASAIKARREAQSIGGTVQGLGEAGARGATFGLSDALLTSLGADPEAMAARQQGLGDLGTVAEVAGAAAPALFSGGGGAAGTLARLTPAGRAAQLGRGVAKGTEAVLGTSAVGRVAGAAVAGGLEGALQGAGSAVSQAALGDHELTAEQLLAGASRGATMGALLGGGTAGLGMGLHHAYTGARSVGRGAVERVLGGAGKLDEGADGVLGALSAQQIRTLGGSEAHIAAGRRALEHTRTPQGRTLLQQAASGRGVLDEIGGRVRRPLAASRVDDAIASFERQRPPPKGGVPRPQGDVMLDDANVIGGVAEEASLTGMRPLDVHLAGYKGATPDEVMAIATGRAPSKTGKLFEPVQIVDNGLDHADYGLDRYVIRDGRHRIAAAKEAGATHVHARFEYDDGSEAFGLVRIADDRPTIDPFASARETITNGRAAEADALAKLPKKLRAALSGGDEIDQAIAAKIVGKHAPEVEQILAARSTVADALEGVGEDVSKLRRSLEEVREGLGYRTRVGEAKADLDLLDELEGGAGKTARSVLETGGEVIGAVAGGLSFGGGVIGRLGGKLVGAATRPAGAIRVVARVRGGLDAIRARQSAAVAAFEQLVDRGARGVRTTARAAAKVTPVAARKAAAERRAKLTSMITRIAEIASRPGEIGDRLEPRELEALTRAAPDVAGALVAGASRAVTYLAAVAPPIHRPVYSPGTEMVAPEQLEAFERRLQAVQDPDGTIELLGSGGLTREHAEALQAVYPRRYAELQTTIRDLVGARLRDGKPVSFEARMQLGALGAVLTDATMRPDVYAQLQASMGAAPQQPPPAVPAKVNIEPPPLSQWQRLEQGG